MRSLNKRPVTAQTREAKNSNRAKDIESETEDFMEYLFPGLRMNVINAALSDAIDIAQQYPQLLSNLSKLTDLGPQDLGLTEALESIRHLTATAAKLKSEGELQ